jgi:O-glycosyl hydrolase
MSGNNPTGIGMSLLRCHIPYDGSDGEIPVMKQAAGFGVTQIWAASWTPPTTYKQNGLTHGSNNNNNFTGAASGAANSADTGYATYLVNYIKNCNTQLNSYGIKLLAVSPQNEPDWDTDYESALWSKLRT